METTEIFNKENSALSKGHPCKPVTGLDTERARFWFDAGVQCAVDDFNLSGRIICEHLANNHNPHATVIATSERAELVHGIMAVHTRPAEVLRETEE